MQDLDDQDENESKFFHFYPTNRSTRQAYPHHIECCFDIEQPIICSYYFHGLALLAPERSSSPSQEAAHCIHFRSYVYRANDYMFRPYVRISFLVRALFHDHLKMLNNIP